MDTHTCPYHFCIISKGVCFFFFVLYGVNKCNSSFLHCFGNKLPFNKQQLQQELNVSVVKFFIFTMFFFRFISLLFTIDEHNCITTKPSNSYHSHPKNMLHNINVIIINFNSSMMCLLLVGWMVAVRSSFPFFSFPFEF